MATASQSELASQINRAIQAQNSKAKAFTDARLVKLRKVVLDMVAKWSLEDKKAIAAQYSSDDRINTVSSEKELEKLLAELLISSLEKSDLDKMLGEFDRTQNKMRTQISNINKKSMQKAKERKAQMDKRLGVSNFNKFFNANKSLSVRKYTKSKALKTKLGRRTPGNKLVRSYKKLYREIMSNIRFHYSLFELQNIAATLDIGVDDDGASEKELIDAIAKKTIAFVAAMMSKDRTIFPGIADPELYRDVLLFTSYSFIVSEKGATEQEINAYRARMLTNQKSIQERAKMNLRTMREERGSRERRTVRRKVKDALGIASKDGEGRKDIQTKFTKISGLKKGNGKTSPIDVIRKIKEDTQSGRNGTAKGEEGVAFEEGAKVFGVRRTLHKFLPLFQAKLADLQSRAAQLGIKPTTNDGSYKSEEELILDIAYELTIRENKAQKQLAKANKRNRDKKMLDANGNPILDKDGNERYEEYVDTRRKATAKRNAAVDVLSQNNSVLQGNFRQNKDSAGKTPTVRMGEIGELTENSFVVPVYVVNSSGKLSEQAATSPDISSGTTSILGELKGKRDKISEIEKRPGRFKRNKDDDEMNKYIEAKAYLSDDAKALGIDYLLHRTNKDKKDKNKLGAMPVYVTNSALSTDMFEAFINLLEILENVDLFGIGTAASLAKTALTGDVSSLLGFATGGVGKYKGSNNTTSFISGDSLSTKPNPEKVSIDWSNKSFSVKPIPAYATGVTDNGITATRMSAVDRTAPMAVALSSHTIEYSTSLPGTDDNKALKVYSVNSTIFDQVTVNGREISLMELIDNINTAIVELNVVNGVSSSYLSTISTATAATADLATDIKSLVSNIGSGNSNQFEYPDSLNELLRGV